ncbi:hypothetical protein DL765_006607 [Monosporascus sp. GIB2]|nr:hypothetical protein DL765_006607 [Monosporascus sp. GIB2]
MRRKVPVLQINQHDKEDDIWIVVNGEMHDITQFASKHPGLYVNKDWAKSEKTIGQVTASGKVKAIFVIADSLVISKREADERVRHDTPVASTNVGVVPAARTRRVQACRDRTSRSSTGPCMHPALGGRRAGDAAGMRRIVLRNRDSRVADTAPPAITAPPEPHKNFPKGFGAMMILVDGTFRRGSDIIMDICLGASAVGLARLPVPSLSGCIVFRECRLPVALSPTAIRLCVDVKDRFSSRCVPY